MLGNIDALLKRVSIFLENGDWSNADIYCEKVLDNDPENGQAYVYKLLAQARVAELDGLKASQVSLDSMPTYKNAVKYADAATSGRLIQYNQDIKNNLERLRLEREAQLKREREISELKAEQNKVGEMLTAAVNKKKWIEGQIEQKQKHAKAPVDIPKLKKAAQKVVAVFIVTWVLFFVIAILAEISSDVSNVIKAILLLMWVGSWVWYFIAGAKLAKADNLSPKLTWINLPTWFLFSLIYASSVLKKIKKGTINNRDATAMESLKSQLEAVEADIENARNQLGEIYSKLCELEK